MFYSTSSRAMTKMNATRGDRNSLILLGFALLTGAILRLWNITQSFWWDEIWSTMEYAQGCSWWYTISQLGYYFKYNCKAVDLETIYQTSIHKTKKEKREIKSAEPSKRAQTWIDWSESPNWRRPPRDIL